MDVSFFWVINQLIISITFIFIIHHIFHVFKKNLTIPKTKDLVKKPIEQYKQIYEDINKFKDNENDIMKNELAEYVKSLANLSTSLNSSRGFVFTGDLSKNLSL